MRRILLIEPPYKNKFPPLGLMKISSYHKGLGDDVYFVKCKPQYLGVELLLREMQSSSDMHDWLNVNENKQFAREFIRSPKYKSLSGRFSSSNKLDNIRIISKLEDARRRHNESKFPHYDRVYITTLFTFYWKQTIETINRAKSICKNAKIYVGGIAASLLPDKIMAETGVMPIVGLLDKGGELDAEDKTIIDRLVPDYSILNDIDYKYSAAANTYFAYTTRGCVRKCPFCAVPKLEPIYQKYIGIKNNFTAAQNKYGEFKHIILMDNNVLASSECKQIISDIRDIGCGKKQGDKTIDFNQGLDARLFSEEKAELLSTINVRPVRIAFDHWKDRNIYERAIRLAVKYDMKDLSNYVLYNFEDTPEELYYRLKLNVQLSDELHAHITSFPMKYHPLDDPQYFSNRDYIGKHWNRKFIRTVQNLLIVTKGVVGEGLKYFEYAFGKDVDEFMEILWTPEVFLRHRKAFAKEYEEWKSLYRALDSTEQIEAQKYIAQNNIRLIQDVRLSNNINKVLEFYYKWGDGKKIKSPEKNLV